MVGVVATESGEDQIVAWKDMTEVLSTWSENQNPPGIDRQGEILALKIVDNRLAVVLFRSTNAYYDALTLVYVNDQWKIIQKGFVAQ